MELNEVLLKRRSVRKYTDEKVSDKEIEEILHAAMSGPSAMNKTPWEFYVVTNETKLKEIKTAGSYTGYDAPLAIVVAADMNRTLEGKLKDFWVQDCSSATENILLAAANLGLGSVWCGMYPIEQSVKNLQKVLGLKENIIPFNVIYIGHPAVEVEPRDQYKEEFVHIIK